MLKKNLFIIPTRSTHYSILVILLKSNVRVNILGFD